VRHDTPRGGRGRPTRPHRTPAWQVPAGSRSPHVERTLAWLARFRRLTVRYERRADILLAFHHLAAGLICLRFVERWSC
jgi:hypothetical protein